ncbi:MAG: LVIVD repeat-containing protein [Candidatus Thorarchaeota archaeon SMTZ1-45]|nr:MAG: hypothetical protein AM325_14765 [Candidatus Thorarchaeota archaeon SMTZ1-45]
MRESKSNREILQFRALLLVVLMTLMMFWTAPPTAATTYLYYEDFTTTAYMDTTNSNVTGWGKYDIKLPGGMPYVSGLSGGYVGFQAVGDLVYCADFYSGTLDIVNVSNPLNPYIIGYVNVGGHPVKVDVDGDYAYVAALEEGLKVVDVSNKSNPIKVGDTYPTYTIPAHDLAVSGNYVYIAGPEPGGLITIDVSVKSNPTAVDYYLGVSLARIAVSGGYVYSAGSPTLRIFDLSAPNNPTPRGSCTLAGSVSGGIAISGGYAFLATEGGFQVSDITNPDSPSIVTTHPLSGEARAVAVQGNYSYVWNNDYGLVAYNITIPTNPTVAGVGPAGWNYATWNGMDVWGDFAYLGNRASLQIWNISDPQVYGYLGVGQSTTIDSFPSTTTIVQATLNSTYIQPSGTSIDFYLSADNGLHWEQVNLGVAHDFSDPGQDLKWRAILSTTDNLTTPEIDTLSISYKTILQSPSLLEPSDAVLLPTATPTLHWEIVPGTVEYVIEFDTVSTFDSLNKWSDTTTLLNYTPLAPLAETTWYWRVAANDSGGDLSEFSTIRSFTIDISPPTWDQAPTNQLVEYGDVFSYDLDASDPSGIDSWWLNDTTHFSIDGFGVITDTTTLSVGDYGLQVWVNDSLNHILTTTLSISVQDTIDPVWIQTPTDQSLEYNESLDYQLQASDLSGIDHWWLNDTTNFAISSAGRITNSTTLLPGTYGIEVRVYDPYNNYCVATFVVTVGELPAQPGPPWVFLTIAAISIIGVLAVGVYIVMQKR